jgi:hypothetical protein
VTATETGAIAFGLQYLWGWKRWKWRWWFHGLGPKMAQLVLAELESDSWDPSEWRPSAVTATHGSTEKESANERLNSAASRRRRDYCPSWVVMVMVACDKVFEIEVKVEVEVVGFIAVSGAGPWLHSQAKETLGRGGREREIDTGKSRWSNSRVGDDNEDGASGCE